jgi:uncharacterized protein YaiL (DUF2058 family)
MSGDNPYPKGSLLEWAYEQQLEAERMLRYRQEEVERAQRDLARWRQLIESLVGV